MKMVFISTLRNLFFSSKEKSKNFLYHCLWWTSIKLKFICKFCAHSRQIE